MAGYKTSPEQLAKNREYKRKNREKLKIQTYRSNGLLYLKEHAGLEDLKEFKKIIDEKEKELLSDWFVVMVHAKNLFKSKTNIIMEKLKYFKNMPNLKFLG